MLALIDLARLPLDLVEVLAATGALLVVEEPLEALDEPTGPLMTI